MILAAPWHLTFLLLIPLLFLIRKKTGRRGLTFSSVRELRSPIPLSLRLRNLLKGLDYLLIALLVLAAARPQIVVGGGKVPSEGVDLVLAIDVSGSMKTVDGLNKYKLQGRSLSEIVRTENRLAKVKNISRLFVRNKKEDRIGLIAFAGKSVLMSPLTRDYKLLDKQISLIDFNLTTDGTAVGMAVASGINLLKDSERKEKAILIMSDGVNNGGFIEPIQAAYLAKNYGIRLYPIELGSFMENEMLREQSDWEAPIVGLLSMIADYTGGKHFILKDAGDLYLVYNEIEKAQKSRIDVAGFPEYVEIFHYPVGAAVLIFVFQTALLNTRYRKLP